MSKFLQRRSRVAEIGAPIHAYDLETTPIADGTPTVNYFTGYDGNRLISERVDGLPGLLDVLRREILLPKYDGHYYYAWNANRFDTYFISKALLQSTDYVQYPFLARNSQLRGLLVTDGESKWFFLDGISATGLTISLGELLVEFTDTCKRDVDLDKVAFDPTNPRHVEYAETDSIGLYHALREINDILRREFEVGLSTTIGRTAINVVKLMMPDGVTCVSPPAELTRLIHTQLKRGGYVHLAEPYRGPVWKHDINQAYAAAQRDAALPCGTLTAVYGYQPDYVGAYEVVASHHQDQRFPFLYKDSEGRSHFSYGEEFTSWVWSIEIEFLRRHGWRVSVGKGYIWSDSFNLAGMVDYLEARRIEVGPKTPTGKLIKGIGNNGYGKTLEQIDHTRKVISSEMPEGYLPVDLDGDMYVSTDSTPKLKDYHQPQIGAIITAHVRIQVMDMLLAAGDDALYSDTDCTVFKAPPPAGMDIDPGRYGAWKEEVAGEIYTFIAKKVYFNEDYTDVVAKGMPVDYLKEYPEKLERWSEGYPPVISRLYRTGFGSYMSTAVPMFTTRTRSGTRVVRRE